MGLDIQTVKGQMQDLIAQRDAASHTFYQCAGAISILSEQLNLLALEENNENIGGNKDVEIIEQQPEQIAEE